MKLIKLLILLVCGCFSLMANDAEIKEMFDKYEFRGSFVLYSQSEDKYIYYNKERCSEQFLPASTFKIPNTLIGLTEGIIQDENYIIRWDKKEYWLKVWEQDLSLKDAMKYSCVPCYQELARNIGEAKMKFWLEKFNYGNMNIEGGIDLFWLEGNLKISQIQQVEFLKKLYNYELPVKKEHIDIVKKIIINEKNDKYTLSAKTGTSVRTSTEYIIGWYVGYIEVRNNVYFFALNIQREAQDGNLFTKERIELTKELLKYFKIIE